MKNLNPKFISELIYSIENETKHSFQIINGPIFKNVYYDIVGKCDICNIYFFLSADDTKKEFHYDGWIFLSKDECDYYFIFKYDELGIIKYSFKINEIISCNEFIIKKLLE